MKIKEILATLEAIAPPALQEDYDNSGLIVGDPEEECTGVLVCIDSIEQVIEEAAARNCNLVIAHHPIVFSGLKRLNGKNYVERTVLSAIRKGIAIYAIHTNLDNVLHQGVNAEIAERLGLVNTGILRPLKGVLRKLVTFVPTDHSDKLRTAICEAGAGRIGKYDNCSFRTRGTGTFRASEGSNPFIGNIGETHSEVEDRLEFIFPEHEEGRIMKALVDNHPYEEVAYYIQELTNSWQDAGAGLIGELPDAMVATDLLGLVREQMKAPSIRYTRFDGMIKKVALCGGSGSFLLRDAQAQGADVFLTADFKYHQFFDAEDRLMICDIGHYESEQFTMELIARILSKNYPKFAVILTETSTNPIHYF